MRAYSALITRKGLHNEAFDPGALSDETWVVRQSLGFAV